MTMVASNDPRIITVEVTDDLITAHLADGRPISVPLAWSWRLSNARPKLSGHVRALSEMDIMSAHIESLRRTVAIGTSCAVKTTFARHPASLMQVKHIELDAIHWLPNWTPRPSDEFRVLAAREVAEDSWITEAKRS